jgi:hypothetical protein
MAKKLKMKPKRHRGGLSKPAEPVEPGEPLPPDETSPPDEPLLTVSIGDIVIYGDGRGHEWPAIVVHVYEGGLCSPQAEAACAPPPEEEPPAPDQTLPGDIEKPDQGLPKPPAAGGGEKPDQGLPGDPKPDQGLPGAPPAGGSGERPDQGLPRPPRPGEPGGGPDPDEPDEEQGQPHLDLRVFKRQLDETVEGAKFDDGSEREDGALDGWTFKV